MKVKAHKRYELKDGTYIPGATTITGLENKPFLVKWANNLGLQGIDSNKYVDHLANIGTLAHEIIEYELTERTIDFLDYTPNEIKMAKNSVNKFHKWKDQNEFEVIKCEISLVSEIHKFGGTADIYCILNGKKTLIDLKTGKAIYPEHFCQVSAYEQLLIENGYPVEDVRILRIGRDESEGFDDLGVPLRDLHWQKFLRLKDIYYINKKLGR